MANDAERLGYALAMAKGEAIIRAMGGDPKQPTPEQAMAAARAMLAPIQEIAGGMAEDEWDKLVAEAIELQEMIQRETH